MILYAIGAYGRTARRSDWVAGKDFRIRMGGPYFSIRNIDKLKIMGPCCFFATLAPAQGALRDSIVPYSEPIVCCLRATYKLLQLRPPDANDSHSAP